MKDELLSPPIRFKDFEKEWEEQPFTKLTYLSGVKNKNNLPLESYSISNENGFIKQSLQFENGGNMHDADKSMYIIVSPKSFAYNPARINVGSIGYYNGKKNVIVSSLYEVFSTYENVDDRFLWHWFKSSHFPKFIEKYQEGGVRQYFYYNKLCLCSLKIPSLDEQIKIGKTLDDIDELINCEKSKLENAKKLKESLLRSCFCDDESNKPKVRFKGFEKEWSTNTLSDYLSVSSQKNKNNQYSREEVYSVSKDFGVINQIKYQGKSFAGATINNYGVVETGDVVYTKSPLATCPYGIIKTNKSEPGIVSVLYAVYKTNDNCNPDFVQTYFEKDDRLNNYLRPLISKGAKNTINISDDTAISGTVKFPSMEEQTKISFMFSKIDKVIELYSNKVELLLKLKASVVDKMFI